VPVWDARLDPATIKAITLTLQSKVSIAAGCISKIERGLSSIPDVTLAWANPMDRRLAVESHS
jgi:hypothetical protein